MIRFLDYSKYLAAIVVALSVPCFGVLSLTFLLFCDSGPVLACFLRAALLVAITLGQVVLLLRAWAFLRQRRQVGRAAAYMLLSVLPVPAAILFFKSIP